MFSIKIHDERVRNLLADLLRRGRDLRPAMADVAEQLKRRLALNVKHQGRTKTMRTKPFKRLSPLTLHIKDQRGDRERRPLRRMADRIQKTYDAKSAAAGWSGKWADIAVWQMQNRTQHLTEKQRWFFGLAYGVWMPVGATLKYYKRDLIGAITRSGAASIIKSLAEYILEDVEGVKSDGV